MEFVIWILEYLNLEALAFYQGQNDPFEGFNGETTQKTITS